MRTIINSQGFRGLGAVNVTRQPLTMCPDNADCSGPIVRDRVPIAPVTGSTNGTMPGETQAPTGMQSPLVGQTVIPQTPVSVVAPGPATAVAGPTPTICSEGLTLDQAMQQLASVQPGITPTQAIALLIAHGDSANATCLQNLVNASATSSTPATASPCNLAFFGDTSCLTVGSYSIGSTTALVAAAAIAALFLFGGKK